MKQHHLITKSLLGIMTLFMLVGMWVMPADAAAPPEQEEGGRRLEYALTLALIRLDALQDRIENISAATDLAEEFIADEQAASRDTTELEAALAEFRTKIDEAQASHDAAAQILDEKAGFDDEGEVVDVAQARETLRTANQNLREAHQALRQGRQQFRQAMRNYIRENRNR